MIITEVLQFADRLVFAETGKHLDDIQKAVVKGFGKGKVMKKLPKNVIAVRVGLGMWAISCGKFCQNGYQKR